MLELPVVRVQVQRRPLKTGRAPWRSYQPSALQQVAELILSPQGTSGRDADGTEHVDVHHTGHPQTRDRKGRAGVSIMATGDYVALRERYGAHVVDGVAGENILVDHPGLAHRAMPPTMTLRLAHPDPPDLPGAEVALTGVHIAEPCVEFTRFCLRLPASDRVGDDVTAALAELGGGARGYKMVAGGRGRVRPGDVLVLDA